MSNSRQTEDSDLSLIGQVIRRRIWVIAICVAATGIAALALSMRAEKQYEATTSLLLRSSSAFEPQRAVDTNLQLLGLPAIARATAERVPGVTTGEVADGVSASQEGGADILEVTATAGDPLLAARIANVYAEEFLAFRVEAGRGRLQTSQIEVIERATPDSDPVSPQPVRNTVFGLLIGLVLGLGLALLLEQLDRRVKREEDLAEATGLTLLASVPKRKAFDDEHLGHESLSPSETEVFRLLRANLRYFKARQAINSVLVTSAEPGEGKTLVSLGLALAAVTSGERTLLIEADLREPGLSRLLELPASGGLSGILSSDLSLDGAVVPVKAGELSDAIGDSMLDVIPAGAIPPNPTELIDSQRMRELIAEAETAYDLVVVDTPPVLVVADSIPLMASVSGVLAVSGLGVSTHEAAAELAEQLERLDAPILGVVANFAEGSSRSLDGYGYGRGVDPRTINRPGSHSRSRRA